METAIMGTSRADKICSSCKKKTVNERSATRFPCPGCASYEIVRCSFCRNNAVKYSCPGCGFTGPN